MEKEIPYSALDSQLDAVSRQVAESRKCIQREPPDLLFHYTNAQGLLGILESGRLWATNYRYLNDASEVRYGMALFEDVVGQRLSKTISSVVSEFLHRTLTTANPFDGMLDCYVACFCAKDDLLSQWRGYTESGGGFAIGFYGPQIGERWRFDHPGQDFMIRRVEYDETIQRSLITEVVEKTCQILEGSAGNLPVQQANLAIARCCKFVRDHIADYLPCFKHSAFAIEEEWRLCHVTVHEEAHVLFRQGRFGLTPYVLLDPSPMAGIHHGRLPIAKIRHSPVRDPSNVRFALAKMLKSKGYAFVEVDGSALPMRV